VYKVLCIQRSIIGIKMSLSKLPILLSGESLNLSGDLLEVPPMKLHAFLTCAALMMLTACTSVGNTVARDEPTIPIASGFTPIASAPLPSNFCQGAAASDRLRAQSAGFDATTLDRIALQSLQQCRTLLAGSLTAGFERMASR
jgi:hypothetical protein